MPSFSQQFCDYLPTKKCRSLHNFSSEVLKVLIMQKYISSPQRKHSLILWWCHLSMTSYFNLYLCPLKNLFLNPYLAVSFESVFWMYDTFENTDSNFNTYAACG